MKNTIAMIQAIANQTMRPDMAVGDVKSAFLARLNTLASAQDLLTQTEWATATLADIVEGSLALHAEASRFRIGGPPIALSSKCALGLALALHELATNANKYGALRNDGGHVEVTWIVDDRGFHYRWQEIGGPPVEPPTRTGFGSRMIEKALPGYVQGQARITYSRGGVLYELDTTPGALASE